MPEDGARRIWEKLDEMSTQLAKLLALHEERDKDCARNEGCIAELKKKVQKIEIKQAYYSGGAVALSLLLNVILKGLGVEK